MLDYHDISITDREQIEGALRRGATRREIMGWLMASGATIATAGALVTSAEQAVAATPQKGGTIRYALQQHGPSDTLDPILFTSGIDYTRGRIHYNSLTQLGDDLIPQPELAEFFESNADASEWTFRLRKDVKFHDGSPMTADDVLFSMNRHLGEDSKSNAKAYMAAVKEWVKTDNHTVKAVLNYPNADMPTLLGIYQFKVIKDGTSDFQNPVGTGPFTLDEFSPGVRSVHTRNEDYWREPANLERIEAFAITDPVARVNAVVAGDVHMVNQIDPKAIGQIESAADVDLISTPTGAYNGICIMRDRDPGLNDDFVLGMKYLQRRDRVVNNVLQGHGVVGNDHPIGPAYPDHCADLPVREYDPDKAKFHLDKSGVDGVEIYTAAVNVGMVDTVLLLQREASKVGFDLRVKKVPTDGYWGAIWMQKPINVTSWNMRPTAHSMLSVAFAPNAAWNDSAWHNERMGELLKMSSAETDPARRKEMFCEMQTLIHNESGMIIPNHTNFIDAKRSNVKGVGKSPLGALGAYEWPEFAWLEA
jgi:peptide/nickel transport system substrate-binding protein